MPPLLEAPKKKIVKVLTLAEALAAEAKFDAKVVEIDRDQQYQYLVGIKHWDPEHERGFTFIRGVKVEVNRLAITNKVVPKNLKGYHISFSKLAVRWVKEYSRSGKFRFGHGVLSDGGGTLTNR